MSLEKRNVKIARFSLLIAVVPRVLWEAGFFSLHIVYKRQLTQHPHQHQGLHIRNHTIHPF